MKATVITPAIDTVCCFLGIMGTISQTGSVFRNEDQANLSGHTAYLVSAAATSLAMTPCAALVG